MVASFNVFALPEDSALSTGIRPISNANNFILDQLIVENKLVLKTSFSPLFY
jgi:hypothetical protein